ncbi:kinase-like domain-containing protein [Podospora didyma]|uniref:Kinase-like domain-containing protein n=1 Tax=Podospora didyma TaxID=330526 RepID=A0AAE0P647_9PEZI|nr:kinase-like domain-containing protein [Podospora didyma]
MASSETTKENAISAALLNELADTRYACSSLTMLSGGSANWLFRGILIHPLPSQSSDNAAERTVIVKHYTSFLFANDMFAIDISRCGFEYFILTALRRFDYRQSPNTATIKSPYVYLFNQQTNTQIHEDCGVDMTNMMWLLFQSAPTGTADFRLTASTATSLGFNLGSWFQAFHSWVSDPAQTDLQSIMGRNEPMRKLKYDTSYGCFIGVLEKFPDLLEGGVRKTMEDVKDMATKEFERPPPSGSEGLGDNSWGIIHGDAWSGNILVSHTRSELFIIDWELAQFGHRAYDLGQLAGDLYERTHYRDVAVAVDVIRGFVTGYGGLSDEMAFRIAIHAGVHLINWYSRRNPMTPPPAPVEKIRAGMKVGVQWILKAWEEDREWFKGSVLGCLFRGN